MHRADPEAHKEHCRVKNSENKAVLLRQSARKGAPNFEYKFNPFPYSFPTRKSGRARFSLDAGYWGRTKETFVVVSWCMDPMFHMKHWKREERIFKFQEDNTSLSGGFMLS